MLRDAVRPLPPRKGVTMQGSGGEQLNAAHAPAQRHLPGTWECMVQARRWLVWRAVPVPGKKPRKVPHYIDGAPREGTLDTPADWAKLGTYHEACSGVAASNGYYEGIAFALGPDEHGGYWQGIDLDDIPHNGIGDLANSLPGYVERSPSQQGAHAIGYGRHFVTLGSNDSGIEAYAGGRFFTVTEDPIRHAPIGCLAQFVEQALAPRHRAHRSQQSGGVETIQLPPQTITELRSALRHMRSDEYDLWIRMGHALKELGDVGRGLWLDWSAASEKFKPQDARRWDGFNPTGTSYQAVFAEAQRRGWVNPNSNAARLPAPTPPDDQSWVVSISDVVSNPPPPPEFLTDRYLPAGEVTLLAAHGGTGKSLLMLMWAVHAALGAPFLGKRVTQAPVIFYSGEDRAGIVRFRLAKICRALDLDPEQVAQRLTVVDATDDPVLFGEAYNPAAGKHLGVTGTYHRLKHLGDQLGARYFFIDNASDTFDADEIKRSAVRRFLRALRGLGTERNAAVMLAAHVDKQTAKGNGGGEDYSGSTAWNNSVRSRLFLEAVDPGLKLTQGKSNHGPKARELHLCWTAEGILEVTDPEEVERIERAMDDVQLAELLQVVEALIAEGTEIPTATTGPRTTFKILSKHPLFPKSMDAKRTNKLMAKAEDEGQIRCEKYRDERARKDKTRWVRA